MTQTSYKAWDGNLYEWPPPEGWYQAKDGRWWPDGYGPQADAVETPAVDSQAVDSQTVDSQTVDSQADEYQTESSVGGEAEPHHEADVPLATGEVGLGPGPADWPSPDAPESRTAAELTAPSDQAESFQPIEKTQTASVLGSSLPPSDYDPQQTAQAASPEVAAPEVAAPEVVAPGLIADEDSFVDTGDKQGPSSFPPPSIGSAQVYNPPAEPDERSPFETAIAEEAQAESNVVPSPSVGASSYPPDLATSRLPATPSFDDVETVGGELPLNQMPTGTPPSLANPAFSGAPTPAGVVPNADSQQTWSLPEGSQVASNIQPSSLPSTEDFASGDRANLSGSGRDKKILFLLAGLLVVAALVFLGSRFLLGDDEEDPAVGLAADTDEVAVDAEQTDGDDVASPSGSSDPSAAEGTFANPHRQDFEVDINYAADDGDRSWRIAVQSPVTEAQDAGTPAEGNVFAVADVLVRNQQADSELAVSTLQFNVATETGEVIRWADAACTSGDPLPVDEVLAGGEEVQGSLCWEVPAESLDSLLLRVETDEVSGQVFIELN